MENLTHEIYRQWIAPFAGGEPVHETESFRLAVNDELDDDERVQILVRPARTFALVTPAIRDLPDVSTARSEAELRAALTVAGIRLNGPDHLFFPDGGRRTAAP
ncbi:hypothetical protein FM113_15990 [Leucobacter sp. 7(1)]|uniref:hypothetical protein n=1 Tax=Leucobacter sp. 7(1) TaxID=1255613 RepID=UPI00097F2222|nr:hypothetical protein [Leucobacter sp. 7(1)]SJN12844.1 hypothetical protein FM113_15990 [Leucobacter sp. 7(1)]